MREHKQPSTRRAQRRKAKGIFCLEDDWWGTMRRSSSLEPILHLLNQWHPYFVPYIHRNAARPESLHYYLGKWSQKSYAGFPILYLALHGSPGFLHLGSGRGGSSELSLEELEEVLAGKCKKRIIFLASCSTIDEHGHRLRRFLNRTGALAVCGYRGDVDWLESAIFDVLVLGAFQENAMTVAGARAMRRRIQIDGCGLARRLQFRMVI